MIAAWPATGTVHQIRITLAAAGLLGAALFAFEATAVGGGALLLASILVAAMIHVHHHQLP